MLNFEKLVWVLIKLYQGSARKFNIPHVDDKKIAELSNLIQKASNIDENEFEDFELDAEKENVYKKMLDSNILYITEERTDQIQVQSQQKPIISKFSAPQENIHKPELKKNAQKSSASLNLSQSKLTQPKTQKLITSHSENANNCDEFDDGSQNSDLYNRKHKLGKWKNQYSKFKSNNSKKKDESDDEIEFIGARAKPAPQKPYVLTKTTNNNISSSNGQHRDSVAQKSTASKYKINENFTRSKEEIISNNPFKSALEKHVTYFLNYIKY